ncbi:hypothetical protein T265_00366 [Opisthorchis viverrini]|uniref:Uncharacterized protein n=1 Tax=Opisthorchis viverrini TaxID=6198 RepID=A0A075A3I2_OPIVI|nr:hypothetical protein T265_00366 [Opisthorchis viverrini]KER33931.1 hypothetical protein T265_00366 [Opisthorchis viverrini]
MSVRTGVSDDAIALSRTSESAAIGVTLGERDAHSKFAQSKGLDKADFTATSQPVFTQHIVMYDKQANNVPINVPNSSMPITSQSYKPAYSLQSISHPPLPCKATTFMLSNAAVTPFRCLASIPPEGSTRARILPGCPSLDTGSRETEVGFEPRTFRRFSGAGRPNQLKQSSWVFSISLAFRVHQTSRSVLTLTFI